MAQQSPRLPVEAPDSSSPATSLAPAVLLERGRVAADQRVDRPGNARSKQSQVPLSPGPRMLPVVARLVGGVPRSSGRLWG